MKARLSFIVAILADLSSIITDENYTKFNVDDVIVLRLHISMHIIV